MISAQVADAPRTVPKIAPLSGTRNLKLIWRLEYMKIIVPELSLVVLIGPSGCGKSTFARKHFKPTEILSSDYFRGLVSDDENDQSATRDAFEALHFVAAKRLAAGRLTVIDATNVGQESREPLIRLAREYHSLAVAVVLNMPEKLCEERNSRRPDRDFGPHVIRRQKQQLRRSLRDLQSEGFRQVFVMDSPEEVEAVADERRRMWNDLKSERGPFDIIGDLHGCFDELRELLTRLGYEIAEDGAYSVRAPEGRKAVFLGDLVDRGPKITETLKLVMSMVESGAALCVPGNHDVKLMRKLRGKNVKITHGLAESLTQLEAEPEEFKTRVADFIDGLVSHYVLDGGALVVAHAGMKESLQGRASGKVRDFALFGETTGETDEYGLPVRYNWAAEYRGKAMVVYGHTPVLEPEWLNRTINVDTGCVFGGKLTALRYPEKELVSAPARRVYYEPSKPLRPPDTPAQAALTAQQQVDDVLDIEDVTGKRIVNTRLISNVTIREENSIVALEVMSRFAANPKWLIYLPPTMSPSETTLKAGLLEHPAEAFDHYRDAGVARVVCEEKHMGSRAVVIVCRDEASARKRFGVANEGVGICYTRTGRRFFDDQNLEREFLDRLQAAAEAAGFWGEFDTDWLLLDCELMPWSAKAQELLRQQYAAVGSASRAALTETLDALRLASSRGLGVAALLDRYGERAAMAEDYVAAYRRYCWPVRGLADLKLAPFHLLATEGAVHADKDHVWHMETLARLCRADEELLLATPYRVVELDDVASVEAGVAWWEELTGRGGQ